MNRRNLFMPDRQWETYQTVSDRVGVSTAELIRRILEYGAQERVLNEVVPTMSGRLLNPVESR